MNPKSKEFLALQAKWYKKLANDGFEDIEQDETHLKIWASYFFKVRHNETLYQAKEEYYRMAGHFLHSHNFKSHRDKLTWELHSNGTSIREIVSILKSKRFKAYKDQVHKTLQRLTKEMVAYAKR